MTTDHQGAELKPCPFCGGSAEITERDVEPQGDPWYGKRLETFVVCGCGACLFDGGFHEGFYDPETRAIAAWNRRPAPASDLRAAAQAVVDRWDSPQWKDEPSTAEFINRLRRALEAVGGDGLPELPEPTNAGSKGYGQLWSPLFTADQMRQYALDALAARAEKAPLSDKQIMRAWLDCTEPGCSATDAFVAGIRFAEKHHGIAPPSDSAAEGGGEHAGSKEQ